MDLTQLAQAMGLQQPGASQADILDLMNQAKVAQGRSQHYYGRDFAGPAGGGMRAMNEVLGRRHEDEALAQLKQALQKQQGLDQYNAKMAELQKQYEAVVQAQRLQAAGVDPARANLIANGGDLPADMTRAEKDTRTTAMKNAEAMGLQPGTPQYNEYLKGQGRGVTVNNNQGFVPKLEQGYAPADPGAWAKGDYSAGVVPIKGSKPDREARAAEAEAAADQTRLELGKNTKDMGIDETLSFLDEAIGVLDEGGSAGWFALGDFIPESAPMKLKTKIDAVASKIALGAMMELKSQSKQGATGFGQLSEKELKILVDSQGSLERRQKPEDLRANLEKIKEHYRNFRMLLNGEVPPGYQKAEIDGNTYVMSPDGEWTKI